LLIDLVRDKSDVIRHLVLHRYHLHVVIQVCIVDFVSEIVFLVAGILGSSGLEMSWDDE
jgi:hypothetical protein